MKKYLSYVAPDIRTDLLPLLSTAQLYSFRQGILGLQDYWPTKNPWFRLVTTVIGMCVVDLHWYDRNMQSGGAAFDWLSADDEQPNFYK